MIALSLKALLGAGVVFVVSLLARSAKNYYIAGLISLFPTFTLITHYIVGSQRNHAELKTTILFSIGGVIPLFVYLIAIYMLIDYMRLEWALVCASVLWCLAAAILLLCWTRLQVETTG